MADAGVAGADAMLKQVQAQIEWQNKDLERLNSMIEAQFAAVAVKQTQQEDIDLKLKAQKLRIDAYKARKTPSK
jgi:D-mannonate dehydratase